MTTHYSERNWDMVAEKWCTTQEQAFQNYPHGHPILDALDDLLMSIGNPEVYSACVSSYLRLVYAQQQTRSPERWA